MDEAQVALQESQNWLVAKHEYDELHKTENCIICFFEGVHDPDYYFSHINSICGSYLGVTCHNKKNVLKMYETIHATDKEKYRLAYFVDRDFDDLLNNPDIFETTCYSIENYYCLESAFANYLTLYFKLRPDSEEYQRAMNFYREEYNSLHGTIDEFNYYYAALRRLERAHPGSCNVTGGDSFPKNLATISVRSYTKNYSLESLNVSYGTTVTIEQVEAEKAILSADKTSRFRGKYEIEHLEKLLEYIIKEAKGNYHNPKDTRILRKDTGMQCIQAGRHMLILSSMAVVTEELRQYLRRIAGN